MINKFYNYSKVILIFVFLLFITNNQYAAEILIYADKISYDKDENIIARGKAKIIHENKLISSYLIIYSKIDGSITLPVEFSLKDERDNYYLFLFALKEGTLQLLLLIS